MQNFRILNAIIPIVFFIALCGVWHAVVILFRIPEVILPTPLTVISAAWRERSALLLASFVTLKAALAGLALSAVLGMIIAILFSQSLLLRVACYPYVIFLQTVPIVAIAPLLLIWSGVNFRTIVLVACIISIFPIISNVTSGLTSINENLRELFRMQSASRLQTLIKLRIPAAIPNLILGLRISCGLAVIGAIVGELFVGNSGSYDGLGTLMDIKQKNLKTAELMAAVMACTVLGVLLFVAIQFLGSVVLRRWTSAANFESDS